MRTTRRTFEKNETYNKMKKIYYAMLLATGLLLAGCELEKEIQIDMTQTKPLLVVSAIGDADEGKLYFEILQSQPIMGEKVNPSHVQDIQVDLYKNDLLVAASSQEGTGILDVDIVPSSSYTLQVSSNVHPAVSSTVTVPKLPLFNDAAVDTSRIIVRKNPYSFDNSGMSTIGISNNNFFPLTVSITDPAKERNFYLLEAVLHSPHVMRGEKQLVAIGTIDRTLIQDNPNVEATGVLSDAEVNTFVFSQLLITDLSFSGSTSTLNLLLAVPGLNFYFDSDPDAPLIKVTISIRIRQVTEAAFDYYRSVVLQNEGVGFFTEPVSILSNIEGGYGCFSLTSSVTKQVLEIEWENPFYRPRE